jgi:hypothetical protein
MLRDVDAHQTGDQHDQVDVADQRLQNRQRAGGRGHGDDVAVADPGERHEAVMGLDASPMR